MASSLPLLCVVVMLSFYQSAVSGLRRHGPALPVRLGLRTQSSQRILHPDYAEALAAKAAMALEQAKASEQQTLAVSSKKQVPTGATQNIKRKDAPKSATLGTKKTPASFARRQPHDYKPPSSGVTTVKFDADAPNRPFTLPPGEFRPKQSLGQNYLSDQNYVNKIVQAFGHARSQLPTTQDDPNGHRVVEIGPGLGALSRTLVLTYPQMTAVEIDQRAVSVLGEKLPQLTVIHQDVLTFDWAAHAAKVGGRISIVANLPYHIVSQVLFSLADASEYIDTAVVTMQLEVAERVTAKIKNKDYGIPSVVFQLYGKTQFLFKIPPTVFFPVPKVDSALISVDFTQPSPSRNRVSMSRLRLVVGTAFRQRRKMLRQSLKALFLDTEDVTQASREVDEFDRMFVQSNRNSLQTQEDAGILVEAVPEPWATKRPEHLTPEDFVELTAALYGEISSVKRSSAPDAGQRSRQETGTATKGGEVVEDARSTSSGPIQSIWRRSGGKKKEDI